MVNKSLNTAQIFQVAWFFFEKEQIRVLKVIKQTGRNKITWVYLQTKFGRRATFLSFFELNQAYLRWLQQVNILKLSFEEKMAIASATWSLLQEGDEVTMPQRQGVGKVVGKFGRYDFPGVYICWNGDSTPYPEPAQFLRFA